MQNFLQVYEHNGEAPLHMEDLQKMLRVRAISDLAECFKSSGIGKNFGNKLQQYTKKDFLSYSKLTYKEIIL